MIDRERWLEAIGIHWAHCDDDPRGFRTTRPVNRCRPSPGNAVRFHIARKVCRTLASLADVNDAIEGLNQRELAREIGSSQNSAGTALNCLADIGFIEIERADAQPFPNAYRLRMPERCCERDRRAAA